VYPLSGLSQKRQTLKLRRTSSAATCTCLLLRSRKPCLPPKPPGIVPSPRKILVVIANLVKDIRHRRFRFIQIRHVFSVRSRLRLVVFAVLGRRFFVFDIVVVVDVVEGDIEGICGTHSH
jgi:hypothetical protein